MEPDDDVKDPIEADTPLAGPVTALARPAVVVDADDEIADVARRMTEASSTAAVVSGAELGIVTDQDLRSRVLAAGASPDGPVSTAASFPVVTVDAATSLGDALAMMLEREIQHLAVLERGTVVGMLDARRLLAVVDRSPLRLGSQVVHARDPAELADLKERVPESAEHFLATGMNAISVLRMLSAFGDAMTRKAVELAGEPPGAFAWLALGSQARHEQGLLTDQDHALVHDGGSPDEWRSWAEGVVDVLEAAGYPRCHGGTMASNPDWCHDVAGWRRWMGGRLANTEPKAVLEVASALDARVVAGDPDLAAPFAEMRSRAAGTAAFMARLAAVASHFRVPLGMFGRMADRFDIKEGAIGPITVIARVDGLAAGSAAEDSRGRISDGERQGIVSSEVAEILRQGFEVASRIRLEHHLDQHRAGTPLDNEIAVDRLTSWEERLLREVFKTIRTAQTALENRYQTGYVR